MGRKTRVWAVLASMALALAAGERAAWAGPTSRVLNRTLPELKFDGVALGEAFDFLHDVTAVNLHINWKALEGIGVSKDTQVNLKLRQVTVRRALELILSEAAPGGELGYEVDKGVIEVTTRELADKTVYTVVYNIEDLLMEIPDFDNAPDFNLESTSQQGGGGGRGGGGGGGGGGQGLFSNANGGQQKEFTKTKDERANDLVQLIEELIRPDVWRDNGGPASIRYFNGNLIITAPRSVHEAIGGSRD